ncbi:tetratricopeptide repeat protein [Amycolatopsis sp. NPDC052450]|uniref:tetratricopeptide repeat protein n=1 Tax=Amycolatopsis sp. NPDC052450 TaxID=3363937 RepID=UPI0037C88CCD
MTDNEPPPTEAHNLPEVQNSGDATAAHGGVANSGVMGDVHVAHHHHASSPQKWPLSEGIPPPLASAFQPRSEVRKQVAAARHRGEDVVLAQQDEASSDGGTQVLAGGGGVGKTQIAAWFAKQAMEDRTDLVVWVNASTQEQVIATFARAAKRAGVPGADDTDLAAEATALVQWLHTTDRTWLIVLDDVTDPAHLAGLWPPHRPGGWTLATTRLRGATLTGSGRQRIDIDTFTAEESARYLRDRLTGDGYSRLLDEHVPALAATLGNLPLALSHAAAYMIDQHETCGAYLARYTAGDSRLVELMPEDTDPDAYGRPVTVALLLALDAADSTAPAGLARPALALAAVLDPDGHPDTLWTTATVTDYLTTHRTSPNDDPVTSPQARAALRTLHRFGLITHTPRDDHRAVRIHALTARAAREVTPSALATVAYTAADALRQLWPVNDHIATDLLTTLLANTTTLAKLAGDSLWQSGGSTLLYTAGLSLLQCRLDTAAIDHWRETAAQAQRLLGHDHTDSLVARGNLASAYRQAGRPADALAIQEQVVPDFVRVLGQDHPRTLAAWAVLAHVLHETGRTEDAIAIQERVVTDSIRLWGKDHPDTLTARTNLAVSYLRTGRAAKTITMLEQVVIDSERLFGELHPNTLTARSRLANAYWKARRTTDAITIEEQIVTHSEQLRGKDHPETLAARADLAVSYQQAGLTGKAISLLEQVVSDTARVLGEDHPDTQTARTYLAGSYWRAGRTTETISIMEQAVTDKARTSGAKHPHTLTLRRNLATAYWQAGRRGEAITILEQVASDRLRTIGKQHPDTLNALNVLAMWRAAHQDVG